MDGRRLGSADGGERLPWLEPIEEEAPAAGSGGGGRWLLPVIAILLLLAAGAGAWFFLSGDSVEEGHGELIQAPPGDYKIPAPEPGGMEVEGEGDAAFPTSEGEDAHASLDLSAVPEAPIALPKSKAATGGESPLNRASTSIQLGAFPSEKAASDAWKALAKRFTYLETLNFSVLKVEAEGKATVYRLRASGANAAPACARLRIAGEDCATLN